MYNKYIHMFWEGQYYETVQISINSFARFYNVILWSYEPNRYQNCQHRNASEIIKNNDYNVIIKSDFFRLNVIYQLGGWWSDCDNYCTKLLPKGENIVTKFDRGDNTLKGFVVNNSLFYFNKSSLFLKSNIDTFNPTILGCAQFSNLIKQYEVNIYDHKILCNSNIDEDAIVYHLCNVTSQETLNKMKILSHGNR